MGLALDEPKENEKATQVNGIDVLVSQDARKSADGLVIDYVNTPFGEGFDVRPAEGGACSPGACSSGACSTDEDCGCH